jgi:hypothetical protein
MLDNFGMGETEIRSGCMILAVFVSKIVLEDSRDVVALFFIVAVREPLRKGVVLNRCYRGCCQAFETCQRKEKSETCDFTSRIDGEGY